MLTETRSKKAVVEFSSLDDLARIAGMGIDLHLAPVTETAKEEEPAIPRPAAAKVVARVDSARIKTKGKHS